MFINLQTGLHVKWSERIQEEFFLQGDAEKELGVEVGMVNGMHSIDAVAATGS